MYGYDQIDLIDSVSRRSGTTTCVECCIEFSYKQCWKNVMFLERLYIYASFTDILI